MMSVDSSKSHRDTRRIRSAKTERGRGPAVSVIMPAYNTAPYIGEALESVFGQIYENYEVIVVNDGSPDTEKLEQVLAPYQSRIVYIKQENRGPSAARNAGIMASRAPLIALLDSDDIWEPDYLAVQVSILEDNPDIDIIYPDAVYFGDCQEDGRRFSDLCPSKGCVTFENLITQRCNVMVSVTARREVIHRAGMFDETLRNAEDFDLWMRVALQGGRIDYHSRVLVRYRRRTDSATSNWPGHLTQILRVVDKLSRHPALTPHEAETLRKERVRYEAAYKFFTGKNKFLAGDYPAAIEAWTEANRYYRSIRLGLAVRLMRHAPGLVTRMYSMRRRLFSGTMQEF